MCKNSSSIPNSRQWLWIINPRWKSLKIKHYLTKEKGVYNLLVIKLSRRVANSVGQCALMMMKWVVGNITEGLGTVHVLSFTVSLVIDEAVKMTQTLARHSTGYIFYRNSKPASQILTFSFLSSRQWFCSVPVFSFSFKVTPQRPFLWNAHQIFCVLILL